MPGCTSLLSLVSVHGFGCSDLAKTAHCNQLVDISLLLLCCCALRHIIAGGGLVVDPCTSRVLMHCQVGPTRDLTLDDKLRALDALHDRQFAERGAKQSGSGLETATFRRK